MTSAAEQINLLPCPFCGGKALVNERIFKADCPDISAVKQFRCTCGTCGAWQVFCDTEADAVGRWNTRATEAAPVASTKTCHWWPENDNYENEWRTQCGGLFTLARDTPSENGMKFCCYCTKKLEEGKI